MLTILKTRLQSLLGTRIEIKDVQLENEELKCKFESPRHAAECMKQLAKIPALKSMGMQLAEDIVFLEFNRECQEFFGVNVPVEGASAPVAPLHVPAKAPATPAKAAAGESANHPTPSLRSSASTVQWAATSSSTAEKKVAGSGQAKVESKGKKGIEDFYTDQVVFTEGALTEAVLSTVHAQSVFTVSEGKQILEAKKELSSIVQELETKKKLYAQMSTGLVVEASMQRPDGSRYIAKPSDILKICQNLRKKALEFGEFLESKASKLLKARQYGSAQEEYRVVLGYLTQAYGKHDAVTLACQLNYQIALAVDGAPKAAILSIEDIIGQLKLKIIDFEKEGLAVSQACKDVKKTIAIGCYNLAQYYLEKGEFALAVKFAEESKELRTQYGASEEELDRIRFIQARIAYRNGDKEDALKKLEECYTFRSAQGTRNNSLIPVLEMLIQIMQKQNNIPQQYRFVSRLLDIQKYLKFNELDIVTTQLKLLNVMIYHVSDDEYSSVMDNVVVKLNKIPVTQESIKVGLCYLELIKIRTNLPLPERWSYVRKKNYNHKTLEIIHKATRHFNAATEKDSAAEYMQLLDSFRERCQHVVEFLEKTPPYRFTGDGQPVHPEDKAEAMLASTKNIDERVEGSSTQERLMALSDFSSEVRHSLVDEADRVLTTEEFEALPEEGFINPYKLRTAQGGINPEFRDGKALEDTKQNLVRDPRYTIEIPPVEIGVYEGEVYSFDTRRLIVHQQAKEENPDVEIRYKKISGAYLQQRVAAIFSPRPWKGFVTAIRRGGKGSESEPYVNPALREQLSENVDKVFKRFPSTRSASADDPNGFPTVKQKAKKIYKLLQERAKDKPEKSGSKNSLRIVKEAEKLGRLEGEYAAYDFLIKQKAELLQAASQMEASDGKKVQPKQSLPKTAAVTAVATTAASSSPAVLLSSLSLVASDNRSVKAPDSAAVVGADTAQIGGIAVTITHPTSGASVSRRVTDVATDYIAVEGDLIPGWQRRDGNIGRHK